MATKLIAAWSTDFVAANLVHLFVSSIPVSQIDCADDELSQPCALGHNLTLVSQIIMLSFCLAT